ncbi:hypothetical protein CWR48_11045 [Oceanobacillus arenosus]|uniref:Uncharacterized protein n=1 Tax=Oceanobacillus arenosus TaxID=1229153 RepID=A0A3D8PS68_9BACI|nr:hypothetical protein [Oceanobacillus arenosus]RDW18121.1 hypothetical protein CWR48_11045 [Oceanobacillus arenosus]
METLPNWFWVIYYIFLLLSLVTGVIGLVRQWLSTLSSFAIILSLLAPLVSFVYVVQRSNGLTELGYLLAQLKTGDLWAIFITVMFLYLIAWNLFLLTYLIIKMSKTPAVKRRLFAMKNKLYVFLKKLRFNKQDDDEKSERVKSNSK